MNAQDTVRNWLQEISQTAGIDSLALDENGLGTFSYGDLSLTIVVPASSDLLQLLIPLASPPAQAREAFFEKLLKYNFLTLETNGATFALDQSSGEIVLCYSQPLASLDSQGFRNLIGSFLEAGEKWSKRLETFESGAAEEMPAAEPQDLTIRV